MNRKSLLESAVTFAFVAGAVFFLIYRFEANFLNSLMPLFKAEIKWLLPEFRIDYLIWKQDRSETVIALSASLAEYTIFLGRTVPPGGTITTSTLAAHTWLHPVLMISILAAWPNIRWKQKPFLILMGIPFIILAELLDVPFTLWGALEDLIYWQIDPSHISDSIGSRIVHFLDGGGRYALSIVLALTAIAVFRRIYIIGLHNHLSKTKNGS